MEEDERTRIRKRQREGIDVGLQMGVTFGRQKAKIPEDFKKVYSSWKKRVITAVKAMEELKMKKTNFYKLVKEYEGDL
jgi:DNA invertase Pin-like site-specific DNA recombinase